MLTYDHSTPLDLSERKAVAVSPAEAEAYFAAASEPKTVRWYDSDHLFTGCREAQADRLHWIREELKR